MSEISTLHEALTKRALDLQVLGKSPKTVSWYADTLYSFALFLWERNGRGRPGAFGGHEERAERLLKLTPVGELNLDNVQAWIIHQRQSTTHQNHPCAAVRERRNPVSPNTINSRARCLRALANWLHRKAYVAHPLLEQFEVPPTEERDPDIVELDTVTTLLNSIDEKAPMGLRDKTIIWLLFDLGLRAGEASSLKTEHAHLDREGAYIEVYGKGRKWRALRLSREAAHLLDRYLAKDRFHPGPDYQEYVFIASTGANLSVKGIESMLKRRCKQAGVAPIHPHLLRHSNATLFMERFGSELMLKARLGHSSLKTTSRYAHIASRRSMLKQDDYSLLAGAVTASDSHDRGRRNRRTTGTVVHSSQ